MILRRLGCGVESESTREKSRAPPHPPGCPGSREANDRRERVYGPSRVLGVYWMRRNKEVGWVVAVAGKFGGDGTWGSRTLESVEVAGKGGGKWSERLELNGR